MMTSVLASPMTLTNFTLCLVAAMVLGLLTAIVFRIGSKTSASFFLTLSLLPMIVSVIIMLVNGNVGTGVAIAGAFALVRFRSAPGTGREIAAIFCAMAMGLAVGMGYIGIAAVLFIFVALLTLLLTLCHVGESRAIHKQLKITIPENLDYTHLFDDVFEEFGVKASLQRIKSTAMGTMFDLTYDIVPPSNDLPKAFLDELRIRNGNLTITLGAFPSNNDTL